MKNALRIVALALLVSMLAITLVSCSTISGTYESAEVLGVKTILEFNGKKLTTTVTNPVTKDVVTEGWYKIEDDKIYTWSNEEDYGDMDKAISADFGKGSDDDGKYITIGALKYYKK